MKQGQKLAVAGATVLIAEPAMQLAHFGGPGVIAGLAAGALAYMVADEIHKAKQASGEISPPDDTIDVPVQSDRLAKPSGVQRLLIGKSAREEQTRAPLPSRLTLSRLLKNGFEPSLDRIFLAFLPDGTPISVKAKDLCHVALAGSTGGGKSSIMRLLMSQLCAAGASVLLLNPHYTRYDIQADPAEDWTPFEPYLVYDPMECRQYDVIEFYLKQIAEDLLPKRLKKYAQSQPLGKPYFLIIDEYPAIVAHIKKAPDYLAAILREGRKVGIYLITASQDFLVSTVSPGGGGAIRDCYRTAMYVGGDPTTAKTLLDMPPREIPETKLGEGTIMLRCKATKQAVLARVPYVDNAALYSLLGPSTFDPDDVEDDEGDELVTSVIRGGYEHEERHTDPLPVQRRHVPVSAYDAHRQRIADRKMPVRVQGTPNRNEVVQEHPVARPPEAAVQDEVEISAQDAFAVWSAGNSNVRDLAKAMGITVYKATQLYSAMVDAGLIERKTKVVVKGRLTD